MLQLYSMPKFVRIGLVFFALAAAMAIRLHVMSAGLKYIPVTTDEAITVLQAKQVVRGEWPLLVMAQPYEFPAEAYLSAPLVEVVPRNALGARWIEFTSGVLVVVLLLWILRALWPWERNWPGALLIVFPSAYVLMTQFGYGIPHSNLPPVLSLGAVLIIVKTADRFSPVALLAKGAAGILAGLAFSETMLSVAILVPAAAVLCFRPSLRMSLWNVVALAPGIVLGLIPFWAGLWLYPDAQVAVAGTRPLPEAFARLWEPVLGYTLPGALGVAPTVYPDVKTILEFGAGLRQPAAVLTILVVLACSVGRLLEITGQLRRTRRWPGLSGFDIFLGAAWLDVILVCLSKRASSSDYRYFLPLAWSFPLLVAGLSAVIKTKFRWLVGGFALVMAVLNVATVLKLTERWQASDYVEREVGAPDLGPAIAFLDARGIRHCVSSHWQAYRINFLTDERILCCQPHNERFDEWPLPYKKVVEASTNVAYVLSDRNTSIYTPTLFERQLKEMGMTASRSIQGEFSVYYEFGCPDYLRKEERIPHRHLTVVASHNAPQAEHLADGNRQLFWTTDCLQEKGMWIQVSWTNPAPVSRLVFVYGRYGHDQAPRVNIFAQQDGLWQSVCAGMEGVLDPFEIRNNHPVYGTRLQSVRLNPPVMTDALRVEITEPNPQMCWTFQEVEIYRRLPAIP